MSTCTLYLRNLNEKVSIKRLVGTLKEECSKYGTVILITAHSNLKMKGQAFVTFSSSEETITARNCLDNYTILNKPASAQIAKTESDAYYTSVAKDETPISERKDRKRRRDEAKVDLARNSIHQTPKVNQIRMAQGQVDWKKAKPHNVLLLLDLSPDTDQFALEELFEREEGFESLRYVKARNLAFVTFESIKFARACLELRSSKSIADDFGQDAKLTFAKK